MMSVRAGLLWLALVGSAAVAAAPQPLSVNTGFTPPVSTIFEQVLREAFGRIAMRVDFQEVSAERSLILVNDGVDDAECCRIPQVVLGEYPNLIAVPESVFEVRFSAFTTHPDVRIDHWEDLRPYSVGTVTGWKILVNNIQRVAPREYYVLDDPLAMFRMLDKGRIEIATLGYLSGLKVIRELGLEDMVLPLEPPLATRELYLMLNKRHAALAPRLAGALAEMKADGTMDAIVRRVVGQLQTGARE